MLRTILRLSYPLGCSAKYNVTVTVQKSRKCKLQADRHDRPCVFKLHIS